MKMQKVTDASFGKYGKVVTEFSYEKILKEMEHTPLLKDVVYAPCSAVEGGFRCVIILPKGTNEELPFETAEDGENRLMTAVNKWLIAHEDAGIKGAFCGLKGENPEV